MSETRKFDYAVEIDAPAEEVWKAISEGDEITKWFAPVARVTPGEGGEVFLSWGSGIEGAAPIRVWEPGKRLGWVEGEGSERPKVCEYIIEAKDGKTTVLRLVQSGFGEGANFDAEIESTGSAWKVFFAMLKYSLERWQGSQATHVYRLDFVDAPQVEATQRLSAAMGLGALAEGAEYRGRIGGIALAGNVLRLSKPGVFALRASNVGDSQIGVFVEKGGPDKAMITIQWILFGEARAREAEVRTALEGLITSTFPAAAN